MIKLNLGCALDIKEGYINIDLFDHPNVKKADVKNLSFISDCSVDEVYAKDVLEHMSYEDGKVAIKEWSRVLKPNGNIFIQTINLDKQIEAYKAGVWSIEDFNYMLFAGVNWSGQTPKCEDFHKCSYNFHLLESLLKQNNIEITKVNYDDIDFSLKNSSRCHNLNIMIYGVKK